MTGKRLAAVWAAYVVLLVIAPLVFGGGAAVTVLSQMGSAIVFCLAYNMLLGQGGMLSFGHAVYYGLGCFAAMHAMQLAMRGAVWLPLPLLPLAGAAAGALAGAVFGYVATRRTGTGFAMITFGIGELVFISTGVLPGFFGGETGLSGTRTYGAPWFGINFGSAVSVYYLIAAWVVLCTAAMYAFTRTPLGRMVNAVRDNAERVAFIGYDATRIRYTAMIFSGLFSGVAGALSAINFESATVESLGSAQSGAVLLFTFIGGAGLFAGPILGAVLGTLMTVLVSTVTKAWPMYLGLFFVLVVRFAPGGLAGLISSGWTLARDPSWRARWPMLIPAAAGGVAVAGAAIALIEMTYRRTLDAESGAVLRLFGLPLDTTSPAHWLGAVLLAIAAGWLVRASLPRG
ncbi:branched-chain amino acid ABC transporter permease [Caenimonas aquaedulcis]|uniref:Branched-chain amino acid ABC transporter permease n=1 Tax=Caenimonas aquaedulcis TaxID=2793270 RepID=A0A931H6J4_9BURK|nr:branched-chain amino acid ABC transporter permease [Caenimonas aquaedulcis]MBG9389348.1 branched-chain amino acid ABC transporter permease [Caenimonas aquaedulcis]